MRMHVSQTLLVGSLVLGLTACGGQTPPPTPEPDVAAAYYDNSGGAAPVVLAASIGVLDPAEMGPAASSDNIAPAGLIDTGFGWHLGPLAAIGPDGSFELEFPKVDADLEAILVPVEEMNMLGDSPTCSLTVSDTAVNVTGIGFEGITVPGVMLLTVEGVLPAIMTDEELAVVDLATLVQNPTYGFAYATGPVDVVADGAACEAEGTTLDLSLDEGWNWLKWQLFVDETDTITHVHATTVERPEEVKLTAIFSD